MGSSHSELCETLNDKDTILEADKVPTFSTVPGNLEINHYKESYANQLFNRRAKKTSSVEKEVVGNQLSSQTITMLLKNGENSYVNKLLEARGVFTSLERNDQEPHLKSTASSSSVNEKPEETENKIDEKKRKATGILKRTLRRPKKCKTKKIEPVATSKESIKTVRYETETNSEHKNQEESNKDFRSSWEYVKEDKVGNTKNEVNFDDNLFYEMKEVYTSMMQRNSEVRQITTSTQTQDLEEQQLVLDGPSKNFNSSNLDEDLKEEIGSQEVRWKDESTEMEVCPKYDVMCGTSDSDWREERSPPPPPPLPPLSDLLDTIADNMKDVQRLDIYVFEDEKHDGEVGFESRSIISCTCSSKCSSKTKSSNPKLNSTSGDRKGRGLKKTESRCCCRFSCWETTSSGDSKMSCSAVRGSPPSVSSSSAQTSPNGSRSCPVRTQCRISTFCCSGPDVNYPPGD